jgi:hypothetical protein
MTDEVEELRIATREAHEAIKDLRVAMKDVRALQDELRATCKDVFDSLMHDAVSDGLKQYEDTLDKAIVAGTEAVENRFDTLSRILLGKGTEFDIEATVASAHVAGVLPMKQRG